MNKIVVSKNNIKEEKIIYLDDDSEIYYDDVDVCLTLVVSKPICIFEYIRNSKIDISYDIMSCVTINRFGIDSEIVSTFNINKELAKVKCYYSCFNLNDHKYVVNINHLKEKTESFVLSHGVNVSDKKLDFLINTNVVSDSFDVVSNQDSKILLLKDSNCDIKPNLCINNDDVVANHSAYIGSFNKDLLFYLMSRGISYDDACKLIVKSFVFSDMDITFLQRGLILEEINKYWR